MLLPSQHGHCYEYSWLLRAIDPGPDGHISHGQATLLIERTMRLRVGCEPCRQRHVKCVKRADADQCERCIDNRRDCYKKKLQRFRPVKSVPSHNAGEKSSRQELTWPKDIDVVQSEADATVTDDGANEPQGMHVRQASSNLHGISSTQDDFSVNYPSATLEANTSRTRASTQSRPIAPWYQTSDLATGSRKAYHIFESMPASPNDTSHQRARLPRSGSHTSPQQRAPQSDLQHQPSLASPVSCDLSPSSSLRAGILSTSSISKASPTFTLSISWPFATAREAKLFHHYVKRISPWVSLEPATEWDG